MRDFKFLTGRAEMPIIKFRTFIICIALGVSSLSVPALAHGDPTEMGAGPGIGADHHEKANAAGEAARNADMQDMMDNGTMPKIPAGPAPMVPGGAHIEGMGDGHEGMMDHSEAADNSNKGFGERLFIWLGKLHTVVIHFPIAMIVAAFAAEAFGVARGKPDWRSAARIMLVIGALGAVAAAFFGWFAGGFYLYDRNLILTAHRYLGMTVAIGSVLLAWAGLSRFHHNRNKERLFAVLLGILTIGVLIQAFLGGTFMHGGINHMNF
ncbi:DUF2231 domain-containing protein [Sphingorhabdus sp. SMR4y]|uniref:DUF2231 domain-containing protein n=1 Tax=Sphingorhabdus sp. SMR4y TaxID=2584094 RepID=UPI0021B4D1E8|nr:DUF2231 domain-containing protein [Sphingorhabdus sp. SMR4y]